MLYKKIKFKWINLNRNLMNAKKNNNIEKINEYNNLISNIEKTWIEYIIQSVWNGNNPIHDCYKSI
jgi:flagellin-specific chaperone FliS